MGVLRNADVFDDVDDADYMMIWGVFDDFAETTYGHTAFGCENMWGNSGGSGQTAHDAGNSPDALDVFDDLDDAVYRIICDVFADLGDAMRMTQYQPMSSVILKIGIKRAMTMPPMMIPRIPMTSGSIMDVRPLTAASTCSS